MSTDEQWPSSRPGGWDDAGPIPATLQLFRARVGADWVDYNGHMSEWCYLLVMGHSSDAFFRYVGIDQDYRNAGGSLFTVETHIRNLTEVREGEELVASLRVLAVDAKRVHLVHELAVPARADGQGVLAATGEQMLLHVDTRQGRTSPLPGVLADRVGRLAAAQAAAPVPQWVGRPMGLTRAEG